MSFFKKIEKLLNFLFLLIEKPARINLILNDNEVWREKFRKKYPHQKELDQVDFFSPELKPEVLHLDTYCFLSGGSTIPDLLLLRQLCASITDCRYFEIGTWRGESALAVLPFCKEVHTLGLSDEELYAMGCSEDYVAQQGILLPKDERIVVHKGNSLTFDFASFGKKFDVVFIDGNHSYAFVKNDTIQVVKHLCHEETIIVWHDYGLSPEEVRYEVYTGILDGLRIAGITNGYLYHVKHTLCAVLMKMTSESNSSMNKFNLPGFFSVDVRLNKF